MKGGYARKRERERERERIGEKKSAARPQTRADALSAEFPGADPDARAVHSSREETRSGFSHVRARDLAFSALLAPGSRKNPRHLVSRRRIERDSLDGNRNGSGDRVSSMTIRRSRRRDGEREETRKRIRRRKGSKGE